MLKQLTAAILIIAFFTGSFSKELLLADYYMHTAPYAKKCINKARPQMHCNGKCQVMKKMQEEEKNENNNKERTERLQNLTISSRSFFPSMPPPKELSNHFATYIPFDQKETSAMPRTHFHPPSFIC